MPDGINQPYKVVMGKKTYSPEDIDIPTLMRSYMYVYGYNNLSFSRQTVDFVSNDSLACIDCNQCSVDCTMGFSIREKVLDIARIRDIPEDIIRHI